ncbi:hypothetical protein LV779_13420 [Streptomyces thinghirensis]|nr:hypothetical protein [Streptomyces thinghirensis]
MDAGARTGEGDGAEPVDAFEEAAGHQPQPVLVAGPAHQQVDAGAAPPSTSAFQRIAGKHVPVDDDAEGRSAEYGAAGACPPRPGRAAAGRGRRRRRPRRWRGS